MTAADDGSPALQRNTVMPDVLMIGHNFSTSAFTSADHLAAQ
jgi:hypothetical protein